MVADGFRYRTRDGGRATDEKGARVERKFLVALTSFVVGARTCTVSYCDLNGVEHAVEVTADSLYEAVAQRLRVFRENDWIDEVSRGQTTISVVVRHPEVQHKVRVKEFERWLESQGRTPAEVSLKGPYENFSDIKL